MRRLLAGSLFFQRHFEIIMKGTVRCIVRVLMRRIIQNIFIGIFQGSCECGNEPSGSIKRGEFLD
jgi:hypothetical protein